MALKRWDPSGILARGSPAVLIVGKRGTGKSTLCKHLLELFDPSVGAPRQRGLAVTHTGGRQGVDGEWAGAFAPERTLDGFSEDAVAAVIAEQYARPYDERERCAVVLDDALLDNRWHTGCVREVLMKNRTLRATVLLTTSYPPAVPPLLRAEFDLVFLLPDALATNRERLYRTFATALPNLEAFCAVFDEATAGRGCLVLDNNSQEDALFSYSVPEPWAFDLPLLFFTHGGGAPHVLTARTFAASDSLDSVRAALEAEGLDPAQLEFRSGGVQAGRGLSAVARARTGADPAECEAGVWAVYRALLRLRERTADAGEAAGLAGGAAAAWRSWMAMLGKAEWAAESGEEGVEPDDEAETVRETFGRILLLLADLYAATGLGHFLSQAEGLNLWRRLLRSDLRERWGL